MFIRDNVENFVDFEQTGEDKGLIYYKARDIGVQLGYGSDGGNFSRNIRGIWRKYLHGRYIEGERGALFLDSVGVLVALGRIIVEDPGRRSTARFFLKHFTEFEEANT